jgi:hypothetical protein
MPDQEGRMDQITERGIDGGAQSALDQLAALRAQRVADTLRSFPLPGFDDRLWATYRLPEGGRATQVMAMISTPGGQGVTSACMNLLGDCCEALFLADGIDEHGDPIGRREFPGCDEIPMSLDSRLEQTDLCPPRPMGDHTPATRIRTVFGRDALMTAHTLAVVGWALGGGRNPGALEQASRDFVGE